MACFGNGKSWLCPTATGPGPVLITAGEWKLEPNACPRCRWPNELVEWDIGGSCYVYVRGHPSIKDSHRACGMFIFCPRLSISPRYSRKGTRDEGVRPLQHTRRCIWPTARSEPSWNSTFVTLGSATFYNYSPEKESPQHGVSRIDKKKNVWIQ